MTKPIKVVGVQQFEPHPSFENFEGSTTDTLGHELKNENGIWGKKVRLLLSPNAITNEVEVLVQLTPAGMTEMHSGTNAHRIGTLQKGELNTSLLQTLQPTLVDGYVYDYPRLPGKTKYSYQVILDI